jgi:hypothetical protein
MTAWRPIRALGPLALVAGLLGVPAVSATPAAAPRWSPAAAERYEEARRLMQEGRWAEAAAGYRSVADRPDGGDFPERAQALFASGLMQSSARDYERALGGAARAIAVQRQLDAARDVLFPAQERVEREGLGAGLEHAVRLLEPSSRASSSWAHCSPACAERPGGRPAAVARGGRCPARPEPRVHSRRPAALR